MNRRIPNLTFHVGATGSMARSHQLVEVLIHSLPDLIEKAKNDQLSTETASHHYFEGVINQLEDIQHFLTTNR